MKKKILYLSYNGMMESLGASQVLSYLYKLSSDYEYYLVSLEKPNDFENETEFLKLKKIIEQKGIHWYPVKYKTSKIGKFLNFLNFIRKTFSVVRQNKLTFVHCRSYFTAITAFIVQKFIPIKYLFDTRNFAFDERADIGNLNREKLPYKLGKKLEKKLYQKASGIVILSKIGKETIEKNQLFKGGNEIKNIDIITTCVDLERFTFHKRSYNENQITIGYVGTAVGWYDFDKTMLALSKINKQVNNIKFLVFNSDHYNQHNFIREKLIEYNIPESITTIEKISFNDMPKRLKEMDIVLFYIHPFFSKRASAATKLGELLASGIPVITNKDVGDHKYYINTYKVGKILDFENLDKYDFQKEIAEINNEETALRCRDLAEKYFSLEKGVKSYTKIYNRIFK